MIGRRRPRAPATALLITAILIGFALEIYTGAWRDYRELARLGAIVRPWIVEDGQYWRLLSAMFLHGDGTPAGAFLHLGLNLFALFQLGTLYELMFGTRRFTFVYFTSGIVASLTSMIRNVGFSVGASGAIFGIVGAFIFSVRRSPRWRHERAARSIVNQLIFWIAANIVFGMSIPKIDMAAHLGGLVAGLVLGMLLPHPAPPPPPPARVVIDVTPSDGGGRGAGPEERTGDR
jgi:rhomboid protease GluP